MWVMVGNMKQNDVKQILVACCKRCGSTNVFHDACAVWSVAKQEWILATVYDNSDCEDCAGETVIEYRTCTDEELRLANAVHRERLIETIESDSTDSVSPGT